MRKKAFTLIELLIVVAIIAILAAIAVPNFLEAQVRSKVARAKADLRTAATGLESYSVDNNAYPLSNSYATAFVSPSVYGTAGHKLTLERLTSPIAYLSSKATLIDPFMPKKRHTGSTYPGGTPAANTLGDEVVAIMYHYTARDQNGMAYWDATPARKAKWWALESSGPDNTTHNLSGIINSIPDTDAGLAYVLPTQYDATNGTVSQGSIWRVAGQPTEPGRVFFRAATIAQK